MYEKEKFEKYSSCRHLLARIIFKEKNTSCVFIK